MADSFPFDEVDVEVHILHDDISELEVLLYSPGEQPVYLHNETGAGVANIDTIYDEQRTLYPEEYYFEYSFTR